MCQFENSQVDAISITILKVNDSILHLLTVKWKKKKSSPTFFGCSYTLCGSRYLSTYVRLNENLKKNGNTKIVYYARLELK